MISFKDIHFLYNYASSFRKEDKYSYFLLNSFTFL